MRCSLLATSSKPDRARWPPGWLTAARRFSYQQPFNLTWTHPAGSREQHRADAAHLTDGQNPPLDLAASRLRCFLCLPTASSPQLPSVWVWTAEGGCPHTSHDERQNQRLKAKSQKRRTKPVLERVEGSVRPTRSFVFVGFIERSHVGAGQQSAQCSFTTGSTLLAGDVAVAIDLNINGINIGLIHCGEIGVLREDNATGAGMVVEIF